MWIFGPKEMGWFGGTAEDLPGREFDKGQVFGRIGSGGGRIWRVSLPNVGRHVGRRRIGYGHL